MCAGPHMETALFLVFERDLYFKYESPYAIWLRSLIGPFVHCEIAFESNRKLFRCSVFERSLKNPDDHVFLNTVPFEKPEKWVFLRVPCTPQQLEKVYLATENMVLRGDYFDKQRMIRAGTPWLPPALLTYITPPPLVSPPEDGWPAQAAGAQPTFCTEICIAALQAADMIPNQPAHRTTATDLFLVARRHLGAYPVREAVSTPSQVDTMGFTLSTHARMRW